MGNLFSDDFASYGSDQALNSAANWSTYDTAGQGGTLQIIAANDRVEHQNDTQWRHIAVYDGAALSTADYTVSAVLNRGGATSAKSQGICARNDVSPNPHYGYFIKVDRTNSEITLNVRDSSGEVELEAISFTVDENTDYYAEITCNGSSIYGQVAGVYFGKYIDTKITTEFYGGYREEGGTGDSGTNFRFTDFSIDDASDFPYAVVRNLDDSFDVTDLLIVTILRGVIVNSRVMSDSLNVNDSDFSNEELYKLISDNIDSLTDSITVTLLKQVIHKILIDDINLNDASLTYRIILKELLNVVTITDSIDKQLLLSKLLTDNFNLTDEVLSSIGVFISRILSGNTDITDSISVSREFCKQLVSSIALSTTVLKQVSLFRLLTDNFDLTDDLVIDVVRALVYRLLSDTLNVSDSVIATIVEALIKSGVITAALKIDNIEHRIELASIIAKAMVEDIDKGIK